MNMDDLLFEKMFEIFREEEKRKEKRQLVIDQKKHDEFMDSVGKLYVLFRENGLINYEVINDNHRTNAVARFYFDRFSLSDSKYSVFLLIIKDVDSVFFSLYKGMVEMTVSKNDVWKEDI